MLISSAFAQTAPAASGGGDSALLSMLPLVLMFVVLYFLMIRPQMKRQKEQRAMIDALQKGDEVVTIGGVLGKIVDMGETYMTLEVREGQMQIERGAVSRVLPKGTVK
ncbi:MAG: preprotein translocase subunit YajC [Brachymonas sp.]|nr:preprotein translocase subunit YajC [Brachymonas sp.]